jgi:hypothetical protein
LGDAWRESTSWAANPALPDPTARPLRSSFMRRHWRRVLRPAASSRRILNEAIAAKPGAVIGGMAFAERRASMAARPAPNLLWRRYR